MILQQRLLDSLGLREIFEGAGDPAKVGQKELAVNIVLRTRPGNRPASKFFDHLVH